MAITPHHHGISVRDLSAWRAAIGPLGFTLVEPGAETPRHYANVDGDPIGRMIAPSLGDEIFTHYIENPETGQQIDLVQISARSLRARPSIGTAQGDTTVGIPVAGPYAAYDAMKAAAPSLAFSPPDDADGEDGVAFSVDGQAIILLRSGEPLTLVHYSAGDWPTARNWYEELLGLPVVELQGSCGVERFRLGSIPARVEFAVSAATAVPAEGSGKKYAGANHFRIVGLDLAAAAARIDESGVGSWLFPPRGRFAQVFGPTNEFIELYDTAVA